VNDPETTLVIGQRRCKRYASSSLAGWLLPAATTDLAATVLLLLPFKNLLLST